ncbi:D-alanyl-D-alanine carboxypeptidase [Paenibacillus sp. CAA11]|uniref:D-alanyl-D-alanine carboxypeptidase family protein n=1 Tax=Paenibacillus sp. CAA11 TaxID=1532905 RepID=UPI000D3D294D|nr:D-alanyl-D-alanine carboxypeptidase family protein [Paenibacillus sp. CAA11]AWB45046.1 D-alanyl-D-alanine carboxypeptidase [Paenibacillus sp. CAA11]
MNTRTLSCRILVIALCSALLISGPAQAKPADADKTEPTTHAQAAALMDVESGRLLYEHQGDRILPIASLTKIMTAIVAIEHGKLDESVEVGKNAYAKEGSSIYLQLGEKMKLEHMLYGLMLRSGNDAATAIAEHVGGSEEGFVHLMNAKAKFLGLTRTHFANPHGLDAKDHYSTASDLARITAYALHNPKFREIVRTPSKSVPNPNDAWDYKWLNKNKMLRFYEGADGVKTGYTKIARRCLVSSATRDQQQLVAVTLNDGDDWNDHRQLLDYGFKHYPLRTLVEDKQEIEGTSYMAAKAYRFPLKQSEVDQVSRRVEGGGQRGASFGTKPRLIFTLQGRTIGYVPIKLKPEAGADKKQAG